MLPTLFARGRPAALALLLAFGASTLIVAPAASADDGSRHTPFFKKQGSLKGVVKCRICAGRHCTVVSVRGRCTKRAALAALKLRLKRHPQRRMPLNPPILDDRSYDSLEKETRRRVPRHSPKWTDHNESDPGMTILKAARRNPHSIRVRPVSPKRTMIPEVDDEVLLGFEHGSGK